MSSPWQTKLSTVAMLVLLAVATLTSGCGGSGLEQVELQGKVSYDGEPVQNGEIMFFPMDGTEGPATGSTIQNGQYSVTNKGGVPVGSHTVVIQAFKIDGGGGGGDDVFGETGMRNQYLPEKYSERAKSELNLTVESGTSTHDFNLAK